MKWSVALGLAIAVHLSGLASAEPLVTEHCVEPVTEEVICPQPGGVVTVDTIGTVACGLGECRQNTIGQWVCSNERGGHAAINRIGQIVCTGGCRTASREFCEVARP